jgi:hypothetical protein
MRNLKALGLALFAALAMCAMGATAAQASPNPTWTPTEGPTTLHGFQLPNEGPGKVNALTLPGIGQEIVCASTTLDSNITVFGPMPEVQLTPTYGGCTTPNGFVTITHNECRKSFYHLTTVPGTQHYTTTAQLICPAGKQIEIHTYVDAGHNFSVCTIDIPPQTFNGSFTVTNKPGMNPTTNSVIIEGTVGGLIYTVTNSGPAPCNAHGTFADGVTHTNITITGQNHFGEHRGIHVG